MSALRIKGVSVPANIVIVDLNNSTSYIYHSIEYLEQIEKVYSGAASKNNSGFIGNEPIEKLKFSEQVDAENLIKILKENNFTKIHLDENCIVGWATRFYKEKLNARKEDFLGDQKGKHKTLGEIRNPTIFKDYLIPYKTETNIKFNYLMDKLNDTLQKKNLGAFYTHPLYAKKSIELVRMAISRVPEGNDYIILDRCAGTGNLEKDLTDAELSHCILSTVEYYEYKVLQELLGSKVRHIIPPIEADDTFDAGLVKGADALSKEYVENPVIKQRPNKTGFYLHEVELKEKLVEMFKTSTKGSISTSSYLIITKHLDKVNSCNIKFDENFEPLKSEIERIRYEINQSKLKENSMQLTENQIENNKNLEKLINEVDKNSYELKTFLNNKNVTLSDCNLIIEALHESNYSLETAYKINKDNFKFSIVDDEYTFNLSDYFIKQLKVNDEHAQNLIEAFKTLDKAIKESPIIDTGKYVEPKFVYEKEKELNQTVPQKVQNWAIGKLQEAGIKIISDKDEFNSLLKSEKLLQKMSVDLSEIEELNKQLVEKEQNINDLTKLNNTKQSEINKDSVELLLNISHFIRKDKKVSVTDTWMSDESENRRQEIISNGFYIGKVINPKIYKNNNETDEINNHRNNRNVYLVVSKDDGESLCIVEADEYKNHGSVWDLLCYLAPEKKYLDGTGWLNGRTSVPLAEWLDHRAVALVPPKEIVKRLKEYLEEKIISEQQKQNQLKEKITDKMPELSEKTSLSDNLIYKFSDKEKKEIFVKALEETSVPLTEIVYSRENYNQIFGNGIIESPIETVKLGKNQFVKLCPPNRNNLMGAIYETISNPSVILEKESLDIKSGTEKPVHVYGKSFINHSNDNTRAVESVIIFREGENIAISLHNKNLWDFVKQIKTTNDIAYINNDVSRVATFIINNGDSHVRSEALKLLPSDGFKSNPTNSNYHTNKILSITNLITEGKIQEGKIQITKDNFNQYFNIFNQHNEYKNNKNKIANTLFHNYVSEENKDEMKKWLESQDYKISNKSSTQNMTLQDGTTYGFTHEGKIYLNPEVVNSSTPIHEYTHLWDNYIQNTNAELWNKGKEAFKDTVIWNEVINDPHYADIVDNDDLVLSECHARITGKVAQKVLEHIAQENGEIKKDKIIDWDKETWQYIAENYSQDISKFVSVAEFIQTPMKVLMDARNINLEHSNEQFTPILSENFEYHLNNNTSKIEIYPNEISNYLPLTIDYKFDIDHPKNDVQKAIAAYWKAAIEDDLNGTDRNEDNLDFIRLSINEADWGDEDVIDIEVLLYSVKRKHPELEKQMFNAMKNELSDFIEGKIDELTLYDDEDDYINFALEYTNCTNEETSKLIDVAIKGLMNNRPLAIQSMTEHYICDKEITEKTLTALDELISVNSEELLSNDNDKKLLSLLSNLQYAEISDDELFDYLNSKQQFESKVIDSLYISKFDRINDIFGELEQEINEDDKRYSLLQESFQEFKQLCKECDYTKEFKLNTLSFNDFNSFQKVNHQMIVEAIADSHKYYEYELTINNGYIYQRDISPEDGTLLSEPVNLKDLIYFVAHEGADDLLNAGVITEEQLKACRIEYFDRLPALDKTKVFNEACERDFDFTTSKSLTDGLKAMLKDYEEKGCKIVVHEKGKIEIYESPESQVKIANSFEQLIEDYNKEQNFKLEEKRILENNDVNFCKNFKNSFLDIIKQDYDEDSIFFKNINNSKFAAQKVDDNIYLINDDLKSALDSLYQGNEKEYVKLLNQNNYIYRENDKYLVINAYGVNRPKDIETKEFTSYEKASAFAKQSIVEMQNPKVEEKKEYPKLSEKQVITNFLNEVNNNLKDKSDTNQVLVQFSLSLMNVNETQRPIIENYILKVSNGSKDKTSFGKAIQKEIAKLNQTKNSPKKSKSDDIGMGR